MFSLFRSRRDETTEVVAGEHDFFRRFERLTADRSIFEAQGASHGEIDLRLTERIENLLVPLLGRWEQSSKWFHQMDYYGDGVRSLTFQRASFPRDQLTSLQALLVGEHQPFAILCIVTESLLPATPEPPEAPEAQYLALFSRKVLVTKGLANVLSIGA